LKVRILPRQPTFRHKRLGFPVPAAAEFSILVIATLVGSLAVSGLLLKRTPGLRRMF
jgi:hypothetical protein